MKSYESSSRVSSKSSRALCFFVSMNFPDLGVYICGVFSRIFLNGMNWASQLYDGEKVSSIASKMTQSEHTSLKPLANF